MAQIREIIILVVRILSVTVLGLFFGLAPATAQALPDPVRLLSEYLQVRTVNPPGDEIAGVRFLARILDRYEIPYRIYESEPGRGNLVARLKGSGKKRDLVLLHHIDVVPADRQFWSVDPFSGAVRDGYVWGRGALDMKSLGIAHLLAFLALKQNAVVPDRDVVFVATADEEAGGMRGAGWLLENQSGLFHNADLVLTEGGVNIPGPEGLAYVGIEVTQKVPVWLRITALGQPGHGSTPGGDSAVSRLLRALSRIGQMPPRRRMIPAVQAYFRKIAPFRPEELQNLVEDAEGVLGSPATFRHLEPLYRALLQDTVAITVLEAGQKTNVIPPVARAELDCRLLPDRDPDEFIQELVGLIGDPNVRIETLLRFEPSSSALSPELVEIVREVFSRPGEEIEVGPAVLAGFTDSHFFRERDVRAYGISPFRLEASEAAGVHGNDERIGVKALRDGVQRFIRLVARLAGGE